MYSNLTGNYRESITAASRPRAICHINSCYSQRKSVGSVRTAYKWIGFSYNGWGR